MISTGDVALVIIAIGCTVWAIRSLLFGKETEKQIKVEDELPQDNGSIVGKSKTRLGQYANNLLRENTSKRGVVPPDEMEQVFYSREEARLNIDVDMEPLDLLNEEMDEDDFLHFEEIELAPVLAAGASFDELVEMSEVIQSHLHDLSQAHIERAARTIRTVENTNLMGQLLTQINSGEQKVMDILDRCDAELAGAVGTRSDVGDLNGFELGKYL